MAKCKCYGYHTAHDGSLTTNPCEAKVVLWIFQQCVEEKNLGKIVSTLENKAILSPTGNPKWNRETIDKLLSNEKYTGRVILQKTVSTDVSQIENNGLMVRYLYPAAHEAILPDELFIAVQKEKQRRSKSVENQFVTQQMF